ncbi:MAG: M23 family metallopeptidase [Saprospiraceae bacterium]|nr:M23 family metallopeptidase [Saprospiraceae bacterium]
MAELNTWQLEKVENKLKQVGLGHAVLEGELLDHLCCAIEQSLVSGLSFENAMTQAFAAFGEDEMKNLDVETISITNQNSLVMKKMLISLAAGMILVFVTVMSLSADPPSIAPLSGNWKISSGFGMRIHPFLKENRMHSGIDLPGKIGTPVLATGSGVVEQVEYSPETYGYHVKIRHDDHFQTLYAQMTENIEVKVGQKVEIGTIIGHVGNSGKSTAPHLHYEVLKDGVHVDPENYMGL